MITYMDLRLREAIVEENIEAVSKLIKQGTNVDAVDGDGWYALELAADLQNDKICKMLMDAGAGLIDIDEDKINSILITSIKLRNVNMLKVFVNSRACLNVKDRDRYTLLHHAVFSQQSDIVKVLLDCKRVTVNARDRDKSTPLLHAVESQNLDIIKLLLEARADVNSVNSNDITPLRRAIKSRNLDVLKLLIDAGVNVNQKDTNEYTPLHDASRLNTSTVKLLLEAGADANVVNSFGSLPLHNAIRHSNTNMSKLLINSTADLNMKSKYFGTPLKAAIDSKNETVTKLLLDAGVDINSEVRVGETPLHYAAKVGVFNIVKMLIKAGANVNAEDCNGRTPLDWAANARNSNILKLFLEAGAEINKRQNDVATPLNNFYFMSFTGDDLVKYGAKLLIECTDINLSDKKGENNLVRILKSNNIGKENFRVKEAEKSKCYNEIIYGHVAKLKALDLPVDSKILDYISSSPDYNYFTACLEELEKAKSMKLRNCRVTFFNLVVNHEDKFVKYAGNEYLLKDLEERVGNFPIYGETMQSNMKAGINGRKLFDNAAEILCYFLPILSPTHLIIRNTLDILKEDDWKKLSQ